MLSLSSRLIWRMVAAEIAADDIAAQGQRQPGLLLPPDAEIDDQLQALILKRQLPFVNDQAGVEFARGDGRDDFVERQTSYAKLSLEQQTQGEKRRRQGAGHGDFHPLVGQIASLLRATTIGPYRSPMLQPLGSRAYLSSR